MWKRILVAYDGSEGAQAALTLGIELAKSAGTGLSSISIEEHLPRYAVSVAEVDEAKEQIDAHFQALTEQARDRAMLEGVELETIVERGHEVERILTLAREGRFDLLILGSHGHSRIFQWIAGSTALSVARLAPCSILIVRTTEAANARLQDIERIVVGVDGSPLGRLAFRVALDLAILCGASLVGVIVREVSPLAGSEDPELAYVRQLETAAEEHARSAGVAFEHVTRRGHAAQALRDHARDVEADLIVLGATGLEHPWSVTLGGTATVIAGEAPCSVLLVRSPRAALHVRDVMGRVVSSVTADTGLAEVVELLLRRDVKAVPVLDARRHVVGIITGGDLLERGDLKLRLSIKRELSAEALGERLHALRQSGKTARDVMSRRVHTVGADADVSTAIRLMTSQGVKRLPVVDDDEALVGIVSRADVLRALAALPEPAHHEVPELPAIGRTVGDAAIREVPVVSGETPAEDVLSQLVEHPLRRVVVVDEAGKVVGLVSDRDVLARATVDTRSWLVRKLRGQRAAPPPPLHAAGRPLTAADLMAPSIITVRPEDSLAHAIRLMMQHRVKRLIVVDADRRFRGLVDRREILRQLAG